MVVRAWPIHPSASLRFGPDGALYAGLDAGGDARRAGDLADPGGKVLRLDRDGGTPDDQPAATPLFSAGHDAPRGLAWQRASGALWVLDAPPLASVRLTAVAAGAGRPAGGAVLAAIALPELVAPSSAAFYRGDAIPDFKGDLLVAAGEGRHLLRLRFDDRDPWRVVSREVLLRDFPGPIRVVAVGSDGAIYFCTKRALARLVKWGQTPFPS